MPDTRSHRGPGPKDAALFAADQHAGLRQATADLNWLLSRGYAEKSSLKLVGDRCGLTERQRTAVMRCSCSQQQAAHRKRSEVSATDLHGRTIAVDGYNVLITIEAALSGGVLIKGTDGCIRDLASIHGTYRRVEETRPALACIAQTLSRLAVGDILWLLDSPVSNSGRLKQMIDTWSAGQRLNWTVELNPNPDAMLIASERIVLSSDSAVLNRCGQWCNIIPEILRDLPALPREVWLIHLSGEIASGD